MPGMKALTGLLWALGGMALGAVLFAMGAALVAQLTHASNREGAVGYFVIGLGVVGGLLGLVAGLSWYARTAPAGQAWQQLGHALLGLAVLLGLVVAVAWAWVQSQELPVQYEGQAQANFELEFRLPAAAAPAGSARQWLSVEVTTRKTRPVALVLPDQVRHEQGHQVVPAVQGPLVAARQRLVVARLELPDGPRDLVFMPRMARKPDPRADWSAWEPPREVYDPRAGGPASAPPLELRWRVRRYGD